MKKWYLGLDIGTNSLGYAATDENYNPLKINNKQILGVDLFSEAQTAEERRLYRSQRRRLNRKKYRVELLNDLFKEEINKIDKDFFLRLEESKYHLEDKKVDTKYTLFNDKYYNDKTFYKEYPTIYHLRESLKTEKNPDIRKVYLAVVNIIKNRGHFLFENLSLNETDLDSNLRKLFDYINVDVEEINKLKTICLLDENITNKNNFLKEIIEDKKTREIFRLIFGGSVSLANLYEIEEYKNLDNSVKSISFKNKDFDLVRDDYKEVLDDNIKLLDLSKNIYDSIILSHIKENGKSLSQSKIEIYEQHKKDIKTLKKVILKDTKMSLKRKQELIKNIFSKDDKTTNNYLKYTRNSKITKSCTYEEFSKYLKEELTKLEDSKQKENILEKIELNKFLPIQKTKDNAVIPYQIHKEELELILNNASLYHEFLTEDLKEKIIQIFEFKIPYFVGPLNSNSEFAWCVRNEGYEFTKVTPWNYSVVINEELSAENFINQLIGNCTYLMNEKVIPKESLLYSKYLVLNEINTISLDGKRVDKTIRDLIYNEFFVNQNTIVTKNKIKKFLVSEKIIEKDTQISGVSDILKSKLKSLHQFKNILGDKINEKDVEKMIYYLTVYGESKQLINSKFNQEFSNKYTDEELKKITNLTFKDWSSFSKKFLTEIHSDLLYDKETGELLNILDALEYTTLNLMKLLSNKYDYINKIDEYNEVNNNENKEISFDLVKNLYVSPSIKRSIWQAIKKTEQIKNMIGSEPTKIFIETTRTNMAPKKETETRHKILINLYKKIKQSQIDKLGLNIDINNLRKELEKEQPSNLKSKQLFLYYSQLGKCVYTGKTIKKENLNKFELYDIDHIYPQSKTKDDSQENTVLVDRTANANKDNIYPLSVDIQNKNKNLWILLKETRLMNDEKYNRLVRTTSFKEEELTGFIARQLTQTSQSVKSVANILKSTNKNSTICYSKAENVNIFKQNYGKIKDGNRYSQNKEQILKVRELNDLHHAYDAYLNIVVGNVYDTKFTQNPKNFFAKSKKNYNYSLNTLFYTDIENAWIMNKTVKIIDKVLNQKPDKINIYKKTRENKGKLFNDTISKASASKTDVHHPIKTSDKRMLDVTKYGGFSNISIAYFVKTEYDVTTNKDTITYKHLIPISIVQNNKIKDDIDLLNYINEYVKKDNKDFIVDNIKIQQKIFNGTKDMLNGIPIYYGGKTANYINYKSALQIVFDYETTRYLKTIYNFINWKKVNRKGDIWKTISYEENVKTFDTIINKMKDQLINKINPKKFNELRKNTYRELFSKLSVENQLYVLVELINLLTQKRIPDNKKLELINFKASVLKIKLKDLSLRSM